jgi:hypothetical protein
VFTARYALSPYIKQIRLAFKRLRIRRAVAPFPPTPSWHLNLSHRKLSLCFDYLLGYQLLLLHLRPLFILSNLPTKPLSSPRSAHPHHHDFSLIVLQAGNKDPQPLNELRSHELWAQGRNRKQRRNKLKLVSLRSPHLFYLLTVGVEVIYLHLITLTHHSR